MLDRRRFLTLGATAALGMAVTPRRLLASTGSRRTLNLYCPHSSEQIEVEYWVDGWYNPDVLAQCNHLMRDRRSGEVTNMDPHLLDLLHALQTRCDFSSPIHVICGYRSPRTNAMLARNNRGVAKNSYHIKGMAVDIRVPGYSLHGLRQIAMDLNAGGVGYYPRSEFLHIDTGPVRAW